MRGPRPGQGGSLAGAWCGACRSRRFLGDGDRHDPYDSAAVAALAVVRVVLSTGDSCGDVAAPNGHRRQAVTAGHHIDHLLAAGDHVWCRVGRTGVVYLVPGDGVDGHRPTCSRSCPAIAGVTDM